MNIKSKYPVLLTVMLMAAACSSTVKFPVSETLPAAEISARIKSDNNNNTSIRLVAKYLASPGRLSPPASAYVVWAVTSEGVRNLGQLTAGNAKNTELVTVTPYELYEIFITVEGREDVTTPGSREISRIRIK